MDGQLSAPVVPLAGLLVVALLAAEDGVLVSRHVLLTCLHRSPRLLALLGPVLSLCLRPCAEMRSLICVPGLPLVRVLVCFFPGGRRGSRHHHQPARHPLAHGADSRRLIVGSDATHLQVA